MANFDPLDKKTTTKNIKQIVIISSFKIRRDVWLFCILLVVSLFAPKKKDEHPQCSNSKIFAWVRTRSFYLFFE